MFYFNFFKMEKVDASIVAHPSVVHWQWRDYAERVSADGNAWSVGLEDKPGSSQADRICAQYAVGHQQMVEPQYTGRLWRMTYYSTHSKQQMCAP